MRAKYKIQVPDWAADIPIEEMVGYTRLRSGVPKYSIAEQRRRGTWWQRLRRRMRGEPPVDFRRPAP
jgi:hypothetical protein